MENKSKKLSVLICRLLAPSWPERLAADNILDKILMWQKKDSKGRWKGLVLEAIDLLDFELDTFLAALISFWADCAEISYRENMASIYKQSFTETKTLSPGWQSPSINKYPLKDSHRINYVGFYGNGICSFLQGIGPRAGSRAKQLAACIKHPKLIVQSSAIEALGSMGPAARIALPEMMADIKTRGDITASHQSGIAVTRIIDDDPEIALQIASDIDPEGELKQVEGPCHVLRLLTAPTEEIVDVILEKYHKATLENDGWLLCAGAELAERLNYAETDFYALAIAMAGSQNPNQRKAAAGAFYYFSKMPDTETILTTLATDPDWTVRYEAHTSAGNIVAPSDELVRVVAKDIGNYEGQDYEPHYSALMALIQWGEYSKVVTSEIGTWIEKITDSGFPQGDDTLIADLAESLGDSAVSLIKPLEKFIDICRPQGEEEEDEETEYEIEEDDDIEITPEFADELERRRAEWDLEDQLIDEQHELMMKGTEKLENEIGLPTDYYPPISELVDDDCLEPWERLQKIVNKYK